MVMLKPHVDALSGEWRGTFQPSNIDARFASFTCPRQNLQRPC